MEMLCSYGSQKRCPLYGIFFFLCLCVLFCATNVSCRSYEHIEHAIEPADPYLRDVYSVQAVRRTLEVNLAAEHLSAHQIDRLCRTYPFSGSLFTLNGGTPHNIHVFFVTVTNVSDTYVQLGTPYIHSGGYRQEAVSGNLLDSRLSGTHLSSIHGTRRYRLTSQENRFDHMDREHLSIYGFEPVIPGDTIVFLFFFDRIPVRIRAFELAVPVSGENGKKTVELQFMRSEKRTKHTGL